MQHVLEDGWGRTGKGGRLLTHTLNTHLRCPVTLQVDQFCLQLTFPSCLSARPGVTPGCLLFCVPPQNAFDFREPALIISAQLPVWMHFLLQWRKQWVSEHVTCPQKPEEPEKNIYIEYSRSTRARPWQGLHSKVMAWNSLTDIIKQIMSRHKHQISINRLL